ncbi:MAG: xanthine dehydrogenase family protein subunit M [Acidobacteriota bacterium]
MIPGQFEYHAPASLREATELLARLPDAKIVAGGMSLIPAMKHRLACPAALVDIARIPDLDVLREKRGRLVIGALVTHATLASRAELADLALVREAASAIGDVQVRNRGTIGGSLVHADPAGDWPAVFLALDGEAAVVGPKGERTIAAGDFFTGMLASALGGDEVLTEVRLPVERRRSGSAYCKLRQTASGFAVVGVAVQLVLDRGGRCEKAGIAITGVNSMPFRAASLEARLMGRSLDSAELAGLCAQIDELDPTEDIHASARYRRHLASVYARRAIARAAERART